MIQALTSSCLIAVTVAWVYAFGCIVVNGSYLAGEENTFILYTEIAIFAILMTFGIYGLIKGGE